MLVRVEEGGGLFLDADVRERSVVFDGIVRYLDVNSFYSAPAASL